MPHTTPTNRNLNNSHYYVSFYLYRLLNITALCLDIKNATQLTKPARYSVLTKTHTTYNLHSHGRQVLIGKCRKVAEPVFGVGKQFDLFIL